MAKKNPTRTVVLQQVRNPKYDFNTPESESNELWCYKVTKLTNTTVHPIHTEITKAQVEWMIDNGYVVTIQ